ncbi:MAG: hypothetical protein ACI906_000501 [Candidatus Latescibacterota bacterium]|jgi:hypothetical protein
MRWFLCIVLSLSALPLQAQLFSPDKLARPHAELEGLTNCTQCHQLGERISEDKCLECHDVLAARIRSDLGYHARLRDKTCIDCHSDHRGLDYEMVHWDTTHFDHDSTGYALTGKHLDLDCAQCHQTESYIGLEQDCISCHQDQHRGQLGNDCTSCHDINGWKEVRFEHDEAQFHLVGKHQEVACEKCHTLEHSKLDAGSTNQQTQDDDGQMRRYKPLPFAQCMDCHSDYHQGQFEQDCADCHGESGWKSVDFNHERALFALLGKHQQVECNECHQIEIFADGNELQRFKPLPFANCMDCHVDLHLPSLGTDCESCHVVSDWRQAGRTFDHSTARFQLAGKHQEVECEACHSEGRFRDIAFTQCMDCHNDYHQGQFEQDCADCHGESDWKSVDFNHERALFALQGKHQQVKCNECHLLEIFANDAALQRFKPLPFANCMDCHADYHQEQFSQDCRECHKVEEWQASTFEHNRSTFSLDGAHANVECQKCHLLNTFANDIELRRYKPVNAECQACHGAL